MWPRRWCSLPTARHTELQVALHSKSVSRGNRRSRLLQKEGPQAGPQLLGTLSENLHKLYTHPELRSTPPSLRGQMGIGPEVSYCPLPSQNPEQHNLTPRFGQAFQLCGLCSSSCSSWLHGRSPAMCLFRVCRHWPGPPETPAQVTQGPAPPWPHPFPHMLWTSLTLGLVPVCHPAVCSPDRSRAHTGSFPGLPWSLSRQAGASLAKSGRTLVILRCLPRGGLEQGGTEWTNGPGRQCSLPAENSDPAEPVEEPPCGELSYLC
jgi:hypothetical protein